MSTQLPFKISTLIFMTNTNGEHLLIERRKSPNLGCWSPIGGKLDMTTGESPYECARRETEEETGLILKDADLHCFGYISEKSYEGTSHWLMFLFNCLQPIQSLPAKIDEGHFAFYSRQAIENLKIPESDRTLLWPYYDQYRNDFVGIRANCQPGGQLSLFEELKVER